MCLGNKLGFKKPILKLDVTNFNITLAGLNRHSTEAYNLSLAQQRTFQNMVMILLPLFKTLQSK